MINDNHRNWYEYLPYALWAYRTIIIMTMRATPFSLVYATEAIMALD